MDDWFLWAVLGFQAFLVAALLIHNRSTLYLSLRGKDEIIAALVRENSRLTAETHGGTPWWPPQFQAQPPPADAYSAYPAGQPDEELEEAGQI